MKAIKTRVPDLVFYEDLVPRKWHDAFVEQLENALHEKNNGHYDGFSFLDDQAFDNVFYPLVKDLFSKFKQLNIFGSVKSSSKLKLGCTLIGYEVDGYIKRHIDSNLLSGDTVVVSSFNSPAIVHFYQEAPPYRHEPVLVEPRSVYVMAHRSRYQWSHEILPNDNVYKKKKIARSKRYAMLFFEPGPLYAEEILEF